MSFWDLLRPPAGAKANGSLKPTTAAELRDALAEAELAAAKAEQDAAVVAQERAELLLEADDKRLDAMHPRLQLAQREADRTAAAVAALQGRVREAEERERQERLDALFAEGQAALQAGLADYRRYSELARELAGVLADVRQKQGVIERVQAGLADVHHPRRVPNLDDAARPLPMELRIPVRPLWRAVYLPHPSDPHQVLYPIGLALPGQNRSARRPLPSLPRREAG